MILVLCAVFKPSGHCARQMMPSTEAPRYPNPQSFADLVVFIFRKYQNELFVTRVWARWNGVDPDSICQSYCGDGCNLYVVIRGY